MANSDDLLAYAIQFAKDLRNEDTSYLLSELIQSGLTITSATPSVNESLTVFVSIPNERVFSVARKCRLKTLQGNFLPDELGRTSAGNNDRNNPDTHSSDDLDDRSSSKSVGSLSDDGDPRSLFSPGDILWMTRHEIENVRASAKQSLKVGDLKITLFQGQSIVEKFMHKNFIEKLYPLHEPEDVKRLGHDWLGHVEVLKDPLKALFQKQPLDKIRHYYGEGVAFYFAFLETLTWALVFPSIIGLAQLFMPGDFTSRATLCVMFLLWAFGLMEWWKRQSNGLSFLWGTRNKYGGGQGEPRANYRGEFRIDPISGQLLPFYPRWKTLLKLYGVSLPIVLLCTLVAFWLMLESIWKEQALMELTSTWAEESLIWQLLGLGLVSIPTVVYAVVVWLANQLYRKLANKLTEWENHRTESQFERNRVTKLLLFEFVNNFMSLFYIAFYLRDIALLQWQVALMLLVFQVINQLTESLWPYLSQRYTMKNLKVDQVGKTDESMVKVLEHLHVRILEPGHYRVRQALKESHLEPYEGTHEDYLELFIQFGYVVLFCVAYPTASLWAWINNVAELRVDAFKLICIHRRGSPVRVASIGAWEPAFRMMCSIAVVSNCALLFIMFTADADGESNMWTRALICVSLDHILLAFQSLLGVLVPAVPHWVQVARARQKKAITS